MIDPQYVAMMNEMMQETLLTGTAHKAELPGWQAAGKTGTSQDWRDAWFVGYTSYLVAGVWLGNDDGSPTKKVSGGNLPVEIWSRFMKAAHQGVPSPRCRRASGATPTRPPPNPRRPPRRPNAGRRAAGDRQRRRRRARRAARRADPARARPRRIGRAPCRRRRSPMSTTMRRAAPPPRDKRPAQQVVRGDI